MMGPAPPQKRSCEARPARQAGEVPADAWAGARRVRCALTTIDALVRERGIDELDLLKARPPSGRFVDGQTREPMRKLARDCTACPRPKTIECGVARRAGHRTQPCAEHRAALPRAAVGSTQR